MTKIEFNEFSFECTRTICPMCNGKNSNPLLTVSDSPFLSYELHMSKCLTCGTCFYCDANPVLGYDHEDFDTSHWYTYVQSGAGITAMLEPLLAVARSGKRKLLDVGCGFGYVPHFWEASGFGDAVGLETSEYGALGAQKLGVKIIPKFYSESYEIHNEKFDYVFCSEVLEHVENPEGFINEISAALDAGGILILTTPSATVLTPTENHYSKLAALSPSFHYFLCSANSLEQLLRKCGFTNIEVRDSGHRLFAWASKDPLPVIEEGLSDWSSYFKYLEQLSALEDPHIASGALYRLLKDYHNKGLAHEAKHALERLEKIALSNFSIDFSDVDSLRKNIRGRGDAERNHIPSWLSSSILFSALIRQGEQHDALRNTALLSLAIEGLQGEIDFSPQVSGETTIFSRLAKFSFFADIEARSLSESSGRAMVPAYILRHPGTVAGKDVCLFAAYSSQGKLSDATRSLLMELSKNDISIILCVALDDPTQDFDTSELPFINGIVVGRNGGFDFSMWSAGLRQLTECWAARRLIFMNDSVFLLPKLLANFLGQLRNDNSDFVAATESYQHSYHTQSYFFMLQGDSLKNDHLRKYWEKIKPEKHKKNVIKNHELKLFNRVVEDWGLTASIMFPMAQIFKGCTKSQYAHLNVSHESWDHLVHSGFPFVKVELIQKNPGKVNILHWQTLFEVYGASVTAVLDHMTIPRVSGTTDQGKWRGVLKGIKKVVRRGR